MIIGSYLSLKHHQPELGKLGKFATNKIRAWNCFIKVSLETNLWQELVITNNKNVNFKCVSTIHYFGKIISDQPNYQSTKLFLETWHFQENMFWFLLSWSIAKECTGNPDPQSLFDFLETLWYLGFCKKSTECSGNLDPQPLFDILETLLTFKFCRNLNNNWTKLYYTTLHYTALHYTKLKYTALHYNTLGKLQLTMPNYTTLQYATL